MNRVVTAVFDGQVLRFDTPPDLEPNARYQITINLEPLAPASDEEHFENAWDVLKRYAGSVEAPSDWSLEHDHYIHGTPKRYSANEQ